MKLLVIYATMYGHTAHIARHIAQTLTAHGDAVDVVDTRNLPADFDLSAYAGVVVGASVAAGRFQRAAVEFATAHRGAIAAVPSAFFSVSLTEADPDPVKHARAIIPIRRFLRETGCHPDMIASFAGSIAYLRYRWLMHLIWPRLPLPERSAGGSVPTARDYEFTDWGAVTRFAEAFAAIAHARAAQPELVAAS